MGPRGGLDDVDGNGIGDPERAAFERMVGDFEDAREGAARKVPR
jgi:hypothetical protein